MTQIKKFITGFVIFLAAASVAAQEASIDLSDPMTLLAACTIEDDGSLGFGYAKSNLERAISKGNYERVRSSCVSYIYGVSSGVAHNGDAPFCLPVLPLEDLRFAVVLGLKQEYKTSNSSVPIIINALSKNWPCQ